MKEKSSEGRIAWLDAARGIGILLIVLGHVIPMTTPVSHFIYSFHVPLFFFLSGMVLQKRGLCGAAARSQKTPDASENPEFERKSDGRGSRQSFLHFIRRKAGSLLYPYVMFSVLSLVCDRLFDSLDRFGGNVPGTVLLLGDGPLWFLPALFIAEVLFYAVHSLDKYAGSGRCGRCLHLAADAALLAVSVWFAGRFYFAVADPDAVSLWSIGNVLNRGIIGFLWMEAGWLLGTIRESDGLRTRTTTALAAIAMICSIGISSQNSYVDLHYSLLGNPVLYFAGGFLAVYAVTELCRRLPRKALGGLAFWGRNSLIVFATHVNLRILLTAQGCTQRFEGILQWVLTYLLVLLVEAVLVIFINRFARWLISFEVLQNVLWERRMRFYIPLTGSASLLLAQYAKYLYMHASAFEQQSLASIKCLTQSGSIPADICLLLSIAMPALVGYGLLHRTEGEQTSVGHLDADEDCRTSSKRTAFPGLCAGWPLNSQRGTALQLLAGNAIWFAAIYKTTELFWSGYGCLIIGGVIVLLLTAVQSNMQIDLTKCRVISSIRNRNLFLWYTFLYALLFGFILCFFIAEHRSLVYHADAWRQHLRAYAYYGKWLRGCAWNLLHGKGVSLQMWSFGLGYGADVLTTLQYYCFGEPLAFLNILVPERYCKLYFEFLIVLRPYLAGLAFTAYMRYTFPNVRRIPLLSGALSYSFCGTVLYLGMLHPFFVAPMIYFPLLLLGVERVLRARRPMVFMLAVWMAGVSNFYYFYMLALLTAGYGVCRVAFRVRAGRVPEDEQRSTTDKSILRVEWRIAASELGRLLEYAVIGTMAAGAILVPVLVQFQSDPRGATEFSLSLFYEPAYYQELFKNLVTFINHPLYDTELCMSVFAAAALAVLLIRKGHRQLKTAVLGCVIMLCFPVAGYLLNGTSYVINRWTFAAELLLAVVLTVVWNECAERLACRMAVGRDGGVRSGQKGRLRHLERLVLAGLVACIAGNIYLGYARIPADENGEGGKSGFASEFTDAQTPAEYMHAAYRNEAAAIQSYESSAVSAAGNGFSGTGDTEETGAAEEKAADKRFLRYSGRDLTYNAGAQLGRSSTQFFWSFANGAVSDFFQALGVNEEQNFCYTGLDDRAALEALAGVQYYSIAYDNSFEQKFVPYGFTDVGTVVGESGVPEEVLEELAQEQQNAAEQSASQDGGQSTGQDTEQGMQPDAEQSVAPAADAGTGTIQEASGAVLGDDSWEPVRPEYHLYSNMFALPLGYTYTGVLSQEEFAAMTPTQRQEAIVQGVLLGDAEQTTANAAMQNVIQPTYYEQELPYTAAASDGVVFTQGEDGSAQFVVTDPEATVALTFTGKENAETYLLLQDLEVTTLQDRANGINQNEGTDAVLQEVYPITVTISRQGETLIDKTINYKTPINQYYSGWKDFALNMGYSTGAPDTITIQFQHAGCYTVSGLSVIGQPMAELMTKSVERSVCTLQNVDMHQNPISLATNEITGTLSAEQDRILVFNIPYSTGWTAYDNGEKVELQKANLMYLAMPAAAGNHEIRLVYHTPGGRGGVLVSAIGILLMVWMVVHTKTTATKI